MAAPTTQNRPTTYLGLVSTWIRNRGFGFVRPDGSDKEIFLHISDCPDHHPLVVNTRVRFSLGSYGNRQKAVNVRVLQ